MLNQVADDEQKGVINCSTLFVQVGNGQSSGDSGSFGGVAVVFAGTSSGSMI